MIEHRCYSSVCSRWSIEILNTLMHDIFFSGRSAESEHGSTSATVACQGSDAEDILPIRGKSPGPDDSLVKGQSSDRLGQIDSNQTVNRRLARVSNRGALWRGEVHLHAEVIAWVRSDVDTHAGVCQRWVMFGGMKLDGTLHFAACIVINATQANSGEHLVTKRLYAISKYLTILSQLAPSHPSRHALYPFNFLTNLQFHPQTKFTSPGFVL